MRLKYQLFLTLLAASAVLIALMYVISSWSFSRGFLEYVNQNEADRLSPVAQQLIEQYEADGDWLGVDDKFLKRSVGDSIRDGLMEKGRKARGAGEGPNSKTNRPKRDESGNKGPNRGRPRQSPPLLMLTDASKIALAGESRPGAQNHWLPLQSDGDVVGYLAFPKSTRFDRQFDQVFESKQKNTFGWTALAMIIFSAVLSIPLASRIVKPLLNVSQAVGEISSGNYQHKVEVNRRDEIGDLANNINSLGVSLEQNRHARQRWIAEISHELRTPLAVLRGEIEAVQDGVRALDKAAVDSLHSEVLSLGRLIDDLHTLSVSDVGALDYQMLPLDLGKLISDVLDTQQEAFATKSLKVTRELVLDKANVLGDSQRLVQLFSNLTQNTCRYTDANGELHVAMQLTQTDSRDVLIIDWEDSSPGVPNDALPNLFDPLYRTEASRSREFGGTGLGLSIAKRIVEAHAGAISAEQSALGGLHIQITLPVSVRS